MEQVQFLLSSSPETQNLNLEFSEISDLAPFIPYLSQFPHLSSLSLFGNHLPSLPPSISNLKSLKALDVSNNEFTSLEDIAKPLQSLSSLESLSITFTSNINLESITALLPRLKSLNDSPLSPSPDFSIKQEDLERVALAYDEIRAIWRVFDESADKALAGFFDESIKVIMGGLSDVAKSRCPPALLNAHMLKAKFELNAMCLDKLVGYSQAKTPETCQLFESVLTEIHSAHKATVEMLMRTIEMNLRAQQEVEQAKSQKAVSPKGLLKFQEMIAERNEMIETANREKEELLEEISSLQEENKKYLDTIIKRTKSSADSVTQKPSQAGQATQQLAKQELKDLMSLIYSSKVKQDLSRGDSGSKETITQHMFSCLAEKFKSRARSIQKASEIVNSIKKHLDDVDVLLFAKILKQDCDENYRFLHDQVRETITEMVKEHTKTEEIKSKNWMEIVRFVYDSHDADEMLRSIPLSKRSKPAMNSVEFINYILHFQLKSHEKYISRFNALFKAVDKDFDGIVSEEEFLRLCLSFDLDIKSEDVNRFLDIVDPANSGKIMYSDCVAVFSTELVPGRANPILQELT